jgi:hypothetical protein
MPKLSPLFEKDFTEMLKPWKVTVKTGPTGADNER